jgi:tetratricopeptide (TPR) repeat protein
MESFIILIVIGIITYLAVQNSIPNRYRRAKNLVNSGNYDEAQKIFLSIGNKNQFAISDYAECFFLQGIKIKKSAPDQAIAFFQKAINTKALLTPISDKGNFENIESLAYYEISSLNFEQIVSKDSSNELKIKLLKENQNYIQISTKTYHDEEFKKLEINHFQKLGELYYQEGIANEKQKRFSKALSYYVDSISNLRASGNIDIISNVSYRKIICTIKNGKEVNLDSVMKLIKVNHPYKNDLLFRCSKRLIENGKFSEAEYILSNGLSQCYGEVDKLREVCYNESVRKAKIEIDKINERIEKIYSGNCSDEEVLEMYNNLKSNFSWIVKVLPDIECQLADIKPSLFNRLLIGFIEKGLYNEAMKLITDIPNFYYNPGLMKNLGNITFNILEKGKVSKENYKHVISHFLTSAYSDKVMLSSLNTTTWDDDYTFTLYDSIGSAYKFHSDLPDNVNYDEPNETNISIGDAQRDLIKQFEILLNEKISLPKLREKVQDFYLEEKNSLEQIVSMISQEILFMTPYFSQINNLGNDILDHLEALYIKNGDESALELAFHYNSKNQNKTVTEYSIAREILTRLLTAINDIDVVVFERNSCAANMKHLLQYETIKNNLEDELLRVLHEVSEKYKQNEDIIKIMKLSIKISPEKSKLKFQFANYVANLCINKVNNDEMSNLKALSFMCDAYLSVPNNLRICKNLITLIKMNIFDSISGQDNNQIYKLIDNIIPHLSITFIQNSEELSNARKDFMSHLPPSSMIAILTGSNLTEKGRRMKEALDYLAILSGAQTSTNPIEELRQFI